ncbi:unnamed protein product [Hymenolepis diminuta]|uniref:RING-type domain-containing protein n=1 Tax=Hymenolepis diminuta TaxID=6216 RepID=A0A0R3SHW8_HYMDI|nr:unnamed protein product [Hymenolepis diminuta]
MSRRFALFDKVQLEVGENVRAFQELPVTCASSGGGYLWIGDADGFMHCLDSTFSFASFRAHNGGSVRLCHPAPGAESRLLATIGLSRDETTKVVEERLCVWNINKWPLPSKSSSPVCCRNIKTVVSGSGSNLGEVVALEVSSTLDIVILGHAGGMVQLIKGDISSDRHAKRIILYDFKSPVTNLYYVPASSSQPATKKSQVSEFLRGTTGRGSDLALAEIPDNGSVSSAHTNSSGSSMNAYLYAASESKLVSIMLGKKDEPIKSTVLDSFGCQPNCSCIVTNPEKPSQKGLAMAHKEAVYFYDADGRGPCLAIEGTKRAICVYKNYIVSIRHNKIGTSMPNFPDPQSSVSLFEYRNKFVGGDFAIPWAHSIITGFGGLFILCVEDGSKVQARLILQPLLKVSFTEIVELIEKDTQSKLDILFARKCFNLAIGIAESDKFGEEELAHIHRRYADHLFNQKQYDLAVKEYIQTIGTVEASYVVLKFLESGLINHLSHYLEVLHKPENITRGSLTKDHTALLLNSYARLDDKERIDAFLERLAGQSNLGKEFYACINVLRRAGYPQQALRLAQITGNRGDAIAVLTEDLKDAPAALREIQSLPFEQALEAVCTHGAFLMQNAPSDTAELLDQLCSNSGGRINAQQFIKIFVNNRVGLMKFLERSIGKSTSKDASMANMVETLLELMLHEASSVAKDPSIQDKEAEISHLHALIMRLLEDPKSTYDEGKALVLCKQRDFIPGCLYIWMKNKQYDQIMEHYVLEDDFGAIMKACEEYGHEAPSLWFEAFKYVSDKPQLGDKLPLILSEIESRNLASPLAIIQFLTSPDKEKCHSLGNVKAYLLGYLESGKERVEANEAKMQRLREETLKNREIARQSQTRVKIFQQQKCAVCTQPLEPPSVHFLCDHSYHKSCYDTYSSDDHLCPEYSVKLLDELEHTLGLENVNLSTTIGTAIAQGAIAESQSTPKITKFPRVVAPPRIPTPAAPKNPFDDTPVTKVSNLADSGLGGSLSSGFRQPPNQPSASGVSLSIKEPHPSKNPFGDENDEEAAEKNTEETEAYPEYLNPF